MKKVTDPFALRLLRWFCPDHLYEEIEGDLLQRYHRDSEKLGERRARIKLLTSAIRFFRPGIVLRNKFSESFTRTIMIGNYITVASRNIMKRKLYAAINALGLSIGIALCMLIFLFIQDEYSFDKFHDDTDNIYRMHGLIYDKQNPSGGNVQGSYQKLVHMQLGLLPAMKAALPEVERGSYYCESTGIMKNGDVVFKEPIVYVDADFFSMFSFPLLAGNRGQLFASKDEIVLTPPLAKKYFGDENPMGKTLLLGDKEITVSGIIASPPANSSLNFQALVPLQHWGVYNQHNIEEWRNMGFPLFVQLHTGSVISDLTVKVNRIMQEHMGDKLVQWRESVKVPKEYEPYSIGLTPLNKIHFENEVAWEKVSDKQYSWILGGIAVLILIIGCINYICLALTSSSGRRIEVGIRKTIGAQRRQVIAQFCLESIVLASAGLVVGIGLLLVFLPYFNDFTGKQILLSAETLSVLFAFGISLAIVVGIAAGSYPAFFLSSIRPSHVLKGLSNSRVQAGFAKPLIVIQYSLAAFLIISAVIMNRQMNYITTKNLGFNQHQIVVIPLQSSWLEDTRPLVNNFRIAAKTNPDILEVSSTDYPFAGFDYMRFGYQVNGENKATYGYSIDPQFLKTLEIELVAGRNFDSTTAVDFNASIIVNEALVEDMGWTNPLEEHLRFHMNDTTAGARVIGVVKNFHFKSLEQKIEPMILSMESKPLYLLVKISPTNIPETIQQLEKLFHSLASGRPFEYTFMDDDVAHQYDSYDRWKNIMSLSTLLAVLISCLGLFGLAGISAVNRAKEIGIRKVMGAGIRDIFILLNSQFIFIAMIAFMIAAPLSWYSMNAWLSHFTYRITMSWELFVASLAGGLIIAVATVSYHAIKSALINPAETLKHE